jgi:sortase family protein
MEIIMKNQILSTRINKKSNKKFFKFQFLISIFIIVILIGFICYSSISLLKKEQMSKNITSNYSIYKLYSNNSKSNESSYTQNIQNEFFGTIEIPKINLYYPVFSHLDEELLKVSPCKFYGDSPKVFGNICIAGHNYDNSMFFSNLSLLNIDDEIYLYDTDNKKYIYKIFKTYEVVPSDLSPVFEFEYNSKELTLITCNNLNSNRLIVKSKQI